MTDLISSHAESASWKVPNAPYGCSRLKQSVTDHARFRSRSHDAVIRAYDEAGNVIETQEHKGEFKEP